MPYVWESYSRQRGYHVQSAFDLDLYNAATGEQRDTWCFVLSENFPPYETGRAILSLEKLNCGRIIYRAYLAKYAKCLATGKWPGYQDGVETLDGWSLDKASKLDELDAMRAIGEIQPVPEVDDAPEDAPNDHSDFNT